MIGAQPAIQVMLTEEQRDIMLTASAYRYPRYSIGINAEGICGMEVWAEGRNPRCRIWGSCTFGRGSFGEMNDLRKAAMAEYDRLTRGSK